jgi:endonuclease YncB( thermonuclease family)
MFMVRSWLAAAFAALCAVLFAASGGRQADSAGPLRVIDGDTFDVGGRRVRLYGVDAPERDQTCADAQGRPFACGAWVTAEVERRFGGARAECRMVERDSYGRAVSRCTVAGRDLGEALVAAGLAVAFRRHSLDYDRTERAAQRAGAGLWAGSFQTPAEFRARARAAPAPAPAAPAAPGDCAIKGNISDNGRIYHMPHNRDYAATRIDTARGERWFCSEEEARGAGWRPAGN